MSIMLNSIELPANLVWTDEFDWFPVVQATSRTEAGVLVREESAVVAGRPITLGEDWIARADLLDLVALASSPMGTHTLQLADGRTWSVAFRYPTPIVARPVIDYAVPELTDPYTLTLNLITV